MAERDEDRGRAIGRIRNPEAYAEGQPDLDVFRSCFDGFVSPLFAGSDVDGLFVCWPPHGLWERRGHVLVQEHKAAQESWARSMGQWWALSALARIAPFKPGADRSLTVVVTYGDPNSPGHFEWVQPNGQRRLEECSLAQPDTMPHRRWIKAIAAALDRKVA
jgi:hypothetical protein